VLRKMNMLKVYAFLMYLFEAIAITFLVWGFYIGNLFTLIAALGVLDVSIYFHVLYFLELKFEELKRHVKETVSYGG
jgi:hypothetical protein